MTRIHLTLDSKYVPNWGMKEGLRELVQNWLDAGGSGRPVHSDGKLVLDNPSASMNREVLLIGHSTKPGTDARGQFGEGLKLGTLALLRDGCTVTVETVGECWTALLDNHPTLSRQVLAWDIMSRPAKPISEGEPLSASDLEPPRGVRVTVEGITGEDWASMRKVFIWDCDPTKSALLQSEDHKGAVYVKGIHVTDNSELAFGYNIHDLKTDRDRKLVDNFQLGIAANKVMLAALDAGEVSGALVLKAYMKNTLEVQHHSYATKLGQTGRQALTDAWVAEHGNTIPCDYYDYNTAEKLRKLGRKVMNVSNQLLEFLDIPSGKEVLRDLKDGRVDHKMSPLEQRNFDWAVKMLRVGHHNGAYLPPIETVKFVDDVASVSEDGVVYLNAKCLDSKTRILWQLAQAIDVDMPKVLDHIIKTNGMVNA